MKDAYLHHQYSHDGIDPWFYVPSILNRPESISRYAYDNEDKAQKYRHRFGIVVKGVSDNSISSNESYSDGISWVVCEKIEGN